jgi:hypothetical protein
MKYKTKSVLITRLPRKGDNEFKTASIKLFDVNNPHMTTEFPKKSFEYSNIEKIMLKKFKINYFLEGNDLIINDLKEIHIEKKKGVIEIY